MTFDCATVEAGASVHPLIDDVLFRSGRECVIVRIGDQVLGIIAPEDLNTTERNRSETMAREVMRPLSALKTASPETSADEAFTTMQCENVNQLAVVSDGVLRGLVTRARIVRLLEACRALRA